jgi:hypothetical protein
MRKGTLAEFFAASPLAGSGLKIERLNGGLREIEWAIAAGVDVAPQHQPTAQ